MKRIRLIDKSCIVCNEGEEVVVDDGVLVGEVF